MARILDIVYEAARKKPWLREECGWILYGAVQKLSEREGCLTFIQILIDKLCQSGLAKTPEGIAIWLKVQAECPKAELPDGVWRKNKPLHPKEKSKLARILKEAPTGSRSEDHRERVLQKGNWSPKIHFVWNVILSELIHGRLANGSSIDTRITAFADFWQEAVDGQSMWILTNVAIN